MNRIIKSSNNPVIESPIHQISQASGHHRFSVSYYTTSSKN